MKKIVTIFFIALSQSNAFAYSGDPKCPTGLSPIGKYQNRFYRVAKWQDGKSYKCLQTDPTNPIIDCGPLKIRPYGIQPSSTNTIEVFSQNQNSWLTFHAINDHTYKDNYGYNPSAKESYRQYTESRLYRAEGYPKLLQMMSFSEMVQKCGSFQF